MLLGQRNLVLELAMQQPYRQEEVTWIVQTR
jgi:hypothetical protein